MYGILMLRRIPLRFEVTPMIFRNHAIDIVIFYATSYINESQIL